MKLALYNNDGEIIKTIEQKDDNHGCISYEVEGRTVALRLGHERVIKILPEINKLFKHS